MPEFSTRAISPGRSRRFACGALSIALLAAAVPALPQQLPWQVKPSPGAESGPVVYQYPEQVQITPGKPQEVDLHFAIRDGLHINSHAPRDKSLIRTELIVAEPPGLDVQAVVFPPGEEYASKAFPDHPLSVYTGELVLHARVVAVKPGEFLLPAALRYQACDVNMCYPPKKAPVSLDVVVR